MTIDLDRDSDSVRAFPYWRQQTFAIRIPVNDRTGPIHWHTSLGENEQCRELTLGGLINQIYSSGVPLAPTNELWLVPKTGALALGIDQPTDKDWTGFVPLRVNNQGAEKKPRSYAEQNFRVRVAFELPIGSPPRWLTLEGGGTYTLSEAVNNLFEVDTECLLNQEVWLVGRHGDRILTEESPSDKDWTGPSSDL